MAGGIGSRFWPVSRTNRPKQFLDFFGTGHTLLQLTYDRFRKIEQYEGLVKQQIPDADDKHILLEPQRRNTAPCIAWAAYRIQSIDPEANIVVTPSDHLILKKMLLRNVSIKD